MSDSESTLLAWATGWRQPSGACVMPVVVWGVSTGVDELAGHRLLLSVSSRRIELLC
jgi:glucose/arabinose dehydrogenase